MAPHDESERRGVLSRTQTTNEGEVMPKTGNQKGSRFERINGLKLSHESLRFIKRMQERGPVVATYHRQRGVGHAVIVSDYRDQLGVDITNAQVQRLETQGVLVRKRENNHVTETSLTPKWQQTNIAVPGKIGRSRKATNGDAPSSDNLPVLAPGRTIVHDGNNGANPTMTRRLRTSFIEQQQLAGSIELLFGDKLRKGELDLVKLVGWIDYTREVRN